MMMANYNFKCNNCQEEQVLTMCISDFAAWKQNKKNLSCNNCSNGQLSRLFEPLASKVSKDKEQMLQEIREEVRKTADKIRAGDISAIRDIYGEK